LIATGTAKADKVVLVLLVAERPCCRDIDPVKSVLDITEDRPLCLYLVPLETDIVGLRRVDD
jgi:hypothetical protein